MLILRATTLRAAGPTLALLLTQVLWFSLPITVPLLGFASGLDPLDWSHRDYYFRWIAIGHASQYLWITAYYARRASGWSGYGIYLAKAAMAATAVWVFPVVLFAPEALGTYSFDAGLAMLVGSAANIHHFILDGVIWKLRSRPVARVLLEAQQPDGGAEPRARRRIRGCGVCAWSTLAVLLAIRVFWSWELQFAYPAAMAREDFAAAAAIWNRLAWFGYDDSSRRLDLGWALFPHDPERALAQFERAVALHPSAKGWGSIANVHANRDDWRRCARGLRGRPRRRARQIRTCSRARGSRRSSSAIRRARSRCSSAPIASARKTRPRSAGSRARNARPAKPAVSY